MFKMPQRLTEYLDVTAVVVNVKVIGCIAKFLRLLK